MSVDAAPHPLTSPSSTSFGGIDIRWDASVLAPRPWTHLQSEWAAELADGQEGPMLELHCGAGAIGLAAAHQVGCPLVQVDVDVAACRWARRNARRLGVVTDVRCATVADALRPGEQFGVVIADPPYLRSVEVGRYPEDPTIAIDGGPDGLTGVIEVITHVPEHLRPDGVVLLQVRGDAQVYEVEQLVIDLASPLRVEEIRSVSTERAVALLALHPQQQ